MDYEIKPLTMEEEALIEKRSMNTLILADVDADESTDVNGVWVEESYRNQGIGTYLLSEIEREAKKKGTYLFIGYACDWNIVFLGKTVTQSEVCLSTIRKGTRLTRLKSGFNDFRIQ